MTVPAKDPEFTKARDSVLLVSSTLDDGGLAVHSMVVAAGWLESFSRGESNHGGLGPGCAEWLHAQAFELLGYARELAHQISTRQVRPGQARLEGIAGDAAGMTAIGDEWRAVHDLRDRFESGSFGTPAARRLRERGQRMLRGEPLDPADPEARAVRNRERITLDFREGRIDETEAVTRLMEAGTRRQVAEGLVANWRREAGR